MHVRPRTPRAVGSRAAPVAHAVGTVHSNGYGHLMRLNGREGGSKRASGRQLMQVRCASSSCQSWLQAHGSRGCLLEGPLLSAGCCATRLPSSALPAAPPSLQLWDDLCDVLRVRQISTEDVSNKASRSGVPLPRPAARAHAPSVPDGSSRSVCPQWGMRFAPNLWACCPALSAVRAEVRYPAAQRVQCTAAHVPCSVRRCCRRAWSCACCTPRRAA